MNDIINRNHPYWIVRKTIQNTPSVRDLFFSYYVYRPQSLIDERQIFSVNRNDFLSERHMRQVMDDAPEGYELAIHSTISLESDEIRNIPMIDMSTSAKSHLEKVRHFIGDQEFLKFNWFKSGRSFHGYGDYIQTDREWVELLGKLLLANQKNLAPTVDPRWVGHRLIAGYSSLRWTKNTEHYLWTPSAITD